MGVLDDLARARTDYERGDWVTALDIWSGVDQDDLDVDDLRGAAEAALLLGRRDEAISRYQRAFRLCEDSGHHAAGVFCAFQLAMIFGTNGEPAMAAGWTGRAERALDVIGPDTAAAGYVTFLQMYRDMGAGELGGRSCEGGRHRRARAAERRARPGRRSASAPAAGSRSTPAGPPRGWRSWTRRWWP